MSKNKSRGIEEETARLEQLFTRSADETGGLGNSSNAYKIEQLRAQVGELIAVALAASADSALRDLVCEEVIPARGRGRLLVAVRPSHADADLDWLREKLERARGYLRAQVAEGIHRKRTPDLAFQVRPFEKTIVEGES